MIFHSTQKKCLIHIHQRKSFINFLSDTIFSIRNVNKSSNKLFKVFFIKSMEIEEYTKQHRKNLRDLSISF